MNWLNFLNGFQFNDYQISHDHIRPKTKVQFYIFIVHRYPDFTFALQSCFL